jgi:class 3 adenylate cyclase/tetratricopeptide (TPR) repeat protein
MKCPRCEQENPPQAKFCLECAAPMALRCANCGTELPPAAKFCFECATPVTALASATRFASPETYTPKHLAERIINSRAAVEGERKQVTVLFADLKGSMELLAGRDPEDARKLLDPVLEHMMEAVHRYEGTVNQVMGDGIMALFGAPIAHEDHAVRACYAALRMQEVVKRHAEGMHRDDGVAVRIRVGLNSGEVVVRAIGSDLHMDYTALGQTTHLAARMEQLADPGSILVTGETLALAEGFVQATARGPMAVKGLQGPVAVFELAGIDAVSSRLQAAVARGLSPFVGRNVEVDQLGRALEQARNGRGQVTAVVGEPGVGKSRLVFELRHSTRVEGWRILEAGASSHGRSSSYLPIIGLLRKYLGLEGRHTYDEMRQRIDASLSGCGEDPWPAGPAFQALVGVPVESEKWQELEPRLRRQLTLETLTRTFLRESQVQPLLLILEDLHWIDAETQAWLDALVDALPAARLLLLVTFRPEYQHAWTQRSYYTQLRIDPLLRDGAEDLLVAVLGPAAELASLRARLIERTDGNPLFLEESVRSLVETKMLVGERGAYRLAQPADDVQIPATIQAILASRIDRLPAGEKQLLQSAAVIGKDVSVMLLQAIADDTADSVGRQLASLQHAEFLYETRLAPESEYTFKHALTQEVAYGSLLGDRRRGLHARIVEAIERLQSDRLGEQVEGLAHHALRAELWDKALRYGREAGAKATARWALWDVVTHLERALGAAARLPQTREVVEQVIDVRLDLRHTIHPLGEMDRAMALMREAEPLARQLGDERRLGRISLALSIALWMTGHADEAQEPADRARALADSTEDDLLRHQTGNHLPRLRHDRGDYRGAAADLRKFLATLKGAGELPVAFGLSPLMSNATAYLGWSLAELGEFAEATRLTDEALRRAEASETPLGLIMACMGVGFVRVRQGSVDAALPALERGLQVCYKFGLTALNFHGVAASLGAAYALADRTTEAIPLLRKVADQSASMKLVSDHLLGALPLAEVWLVTGRVGDAAELGSRALALASRHGQRGHEVYARRLLGAVAARRDPPDVAAAEGHYRGALELAQELGMRPQVAHCHLGLGKLYRRTDRREHAREHFATAATMYRNMGMTYWLERAEAETAESR